MTAVIVLLVLFSQVTLVAGEILLKYGMNHFGKDRSHLRRVAYGLGGGAALLTVWFLVWMGLLQKMDLSFLYPLQGISPVLMVLAAMVFLKEHAGWRTWLGVGLITAGTLLVALSLP